MTERPYEAPSIVEIGTLHDLTLQHTYKDQTGLDGVIFNNTALGPVT
ncbi:MAG: hypothetical protein QOJ20_6118 [Mycobacterium sp.]|jgi:hypothetical protein|nr:hypothetical protein [Mycobacterium sp.]